MTLLINGERLVAKVLTRMVVGDRATLLEAIRAMNEAAQATVLVRGTRGRIVGLITDGDIRRALLAGRSVSDRCLPDVMNRAFRHVGPAAGRAEVLDLMRALQIEQIPVLDARKRLRGLHRLHDLVGVPERGNWAVIMAGGRGTRLHPLTEQLPKPMITVAGRPILERLVLHLVGHGIGRIFLAVNYMANSIEEHFGNGERFGCRIEYLRERKPLGTGGALGLLRERATRPILVLNGDLVTQFDVGQMLDFHDGGGFAVTFGIRPHQMDIPFGVAEVRGRRLVSMKEKPTHRMLVNAGIYVLSPRALGLIRRNREFAMTDLVDGCTRRGLTMGAHLIEDEWADVGRHDELRRARGLT